MADENFAIVNYERVNIAIGISAKVPALIWPNAAKRQRINHKRLRRKGGPATVAAKNY